MLTIGTRGSALALWQARYIAGMLEANGHTTSLRTIRTTGDRILDVPLSKIGDEALFTKELDAALVKKEVDVAVHSLKDLPSELPAGVIIAAVAERAAPWDAFVAHPDFSGGMEMLPEGSVVATSSLRRKAQLLAWRPDLEVASVRGNVDTRLDKLDAGQWRGMVLAVAGLERLGRADRVREEIDPQIMLPAVAQGALGVVCRSDDEATRAIVHASANDEEAESATKCERAFLRRLEGGCQAPIGAYAKLEADALTLEGCVASLDGSLMVRDAARGSPADTEALGVELAETLLEKGGGDILSAVRRKM